MKTIQSASTVHSVDKAMNLIEIILTNKKPLALSELTVLSGYPKSTIHALLTTLRDHEMIEQAADGKYFLGIRLFECGCALSRSWDISLMSKKYLEYLCNSSGETAFVCAVVKHDIITVDQLSGNSGINIVSNIGSKIPLHCTSQGKLLLSNLSDTEVCAILAKTEMKAFTPHTIIDKENFFADLNKIRLNGYSVEDGEHRVGLRSISAPVYDTTGKMKYIIGIIGLLDKPNTEFFTSTIKQVCEIARQLSEQLGYRAKG